jgi:hypothetical protein
MPDAIPGPDPRRDHDHEDFPLMRGKVFMIMKEGPRAAAPQAPIGVTFHPRAAGKTE